ncbi:MAG: hypothetical protein K8R59_14880 [Thermoanaerobaculales bacterium]|nr:hypothetical protein [Thermoanaerobaculales bacterium]
MNSRTLTTIGLILVFGSIAGAIDAPFPRHPAPSPDGSRIAFSWQGDLWVVSAQGGAAQPLTSHAASEAYPIWSRDGRHIAFASNRHGKFDIFVMSVDGSAAPTRLTYADRNDIPLDFTPDGKGILFSSSRAVSTRWMPALWTVPVKGGTPVLAQTALGEHGSYSPNGAALAFVRGATKWTRHGYRGAASRTPWLRDSSGDFTKLSDFEGDEDHPMWVDDHTLAILSSRSERKNIFLSNLVTGEFSPLTHHKGTDVRFPRISGDGFLIAYEFEQSIWTVHSAAGESQRLKIDVPADRASEQIIRRTATDGAEDLSIHPEGSLAAFVVDGDIYVAEILSEDDQEIAAPTTVRVTHTPERETLPRWSPDGEKLLFSSSRSGNNDLWIAQPDDGDAGWLESFDFPVRQITTSAAEEADGQWSPDGKRIAYVSGKGDLAVVDANGGEPQILFEHWSEIDFQWSPDGRWIAFSNFDEHFNAEVWIIPSSGGDAYNVSRHPDDDVQPSWSPDGRRLLWVSKRHRDSLDVWGVWLTRADDERTAAQWLKTFNAKPEKDEKENGEDEGEESEKPDELVDVSIDFDDLWRRAAAVSSENGNELSPLATPDGKRVVFAASPDGDSDLYSLRYDGKDLKRLTEGGAEPSEVQISKDGKTLYYLNAKGHIKRVGIGGKAGDPMPFAARVSVDLEARRAATFDEAWRALNEWFYDPDFHGVDWKSKSEIYRPWALKATQDRDFADILNLMLGELNASHMGYRPHRNGGGEHTGWIGATFDAEAGGPGILVDEVLTDGPAAAVEVGLLPGDRFLAVEGTKVGPDTNVYSLFVDTVERRIPIRIRTADGSERTAVVIPQSYTDQDDLRYDTWVRQRRAFTNEYSDGRLGYLHIQSMNTPSFEKFERDLQAAGEGKEGMVIDVRSNGGGWTTDYLMAVLMVRRHAFTIPRDDQSNIKAYPQSRLPLAAWAHPAVTLCNEDSYSNAEIFSHAFKTFERGQLVGNTTFGAVISTGGTRLPNGAWVRLPMRGWYVADSSMNMENNGAVPDVLVLQPPSEDTQVLEDTQLRRAVDVLLSTIETDPRKDAW